MDETRDLISEIKKELRANMNGVASAAMRQTEDYRVNWGVELPRIQMIAAEFQPSRELAQALWNERVRECKILACMLMPTEDFSEELCDVWVESIRTEEIAQMLCLYLMPRVPFASAKAFQWMASEHRITQCCGFLTICHLLRQHPLSDDAATEFLDQAASLLPDKYAVRALRTFASQNDENERKVKKLADYL